jgi:pyruvate kinase
VLRQSSKGRPLRPPFLRPPRLLAVPLGAVVGTNLTGEATESKQRRQYMRRTKIIATIGPACDQPGVMDALIEAGVDVARLNASHTTREDLVRRLGMVRAAAQRAGRHVAVLLDLGGPKLRVGEMTIGTELADGAVFEIRSGSGTGDASHAYVNHEALANDVAAGDRILLDDGRITLLVTDVAGGHVLTTVEVGGPLSRHKGVNVPGIRLTLEAITPKDIDDLSWALEAGVDMVAQSFVRDAEDVHRLREAMGAFPIPIVAKIEKHEAAGDIESIVAAADAVMVARGDLGVETSPEEVPVIQRAIIASCRAAGRPVIVATQMLESMVHLLRPTRAEASDVANAVFESVDAVMLSAETAVGDHPALVVETMGRICVTAEEYGLADVNAHPLTARELDLAAIVTATESGATPRAVAAHRPAVPIVAITPDEAVARRLSLVRGVYPHVVPAVRTLEDMAAAAVEVARATGVARPGDLVALTAGVAFNAPGTTDLIRVLHV